MISILERTAFQLLTYYRRNTFAKLLEGAMIVAYFTTFIHLTTSESLSSHALIGSACLILVTMGFCSNPFAKLRGSASPIWVQLSALASGFWVFSLFRFTGFVEWPLNRAADLADYTRLLYFHFILSASVLTPVVITGNTATTQDKVSWSTWQGSSLSIPLRTALGLGLFGVWGWAFFEVISVKPQASGPIVGLIVISLLKAALTGATEEICYRGVIQTTAIARFGIPAGIVLQSCLYSAFHMHLGEIFHSHPGFLAGVMALGLIFGMVTHLSGGIRSAFVMHTAIDFVIEWRNIS